MSWTPDQLEFAISQYLDGMLPPLERTALEQRLATDEQARALLAEYHRLDELVRAGAGPAPQVAWDRLAAHLSAQVADADPPVRSLKLRLGVLPKLVAIAASIVVAVGTMWVVLHRGGERSTSPAGQQITAVPTGPSRGELIVEGPSPAPTTGPALAEISVQQPPAPAAEGVMQNWHADAIITRPSSVLIAPDQPPAQDTDDLPQ